MNELVAVHAPATRLPLTDRLALEQRIALERWARDPRRADLPEVPGAMLGRLADDSVDVAV